MRLPVDKMVGFGSDGASVYMGRVSGVGSQLRLKLCFLLAVHCCAHRTALVMGDTGDDLPQLGKIDTLLKNVHGLFARNSKMQEKWERFAKEHGRTCFKFPAFNSTRWFSRMQCVIVLVVNAHTFLLFLKRHKRDWQQAKSVYRQLSDLRVLAKLFVLRDLLGPCEALSKVFQCDSLLAHEILPALNDCKQELISRASSPWGNGRALLLLKVGLAGKRWTVDGKTVTLTHSLEAAGVQAFAERFSDSVIKHLDERFADAGLLHCFRIFDPATYKGMSDDVRAKFGEAELMRLLQHYCHAENAQRLFPLTSSLFTGLLTEFKHIKAKLAHQTTLGRLRWSDAWAAMARESVHLFPTLIHLVYVASVLPTQTACVERGFSRHKIVKNRLRNRLKVPTVDSLLRVGFLGTAADGSHKCESLLQQAAALYTSKATGLLHALFKSVADMNLAAYGAEDAMHEDEEEEEVAFPSGEEEVESDSEYGSCSGDDSDGGSESGEVSSDEGREEVPLEVVGEGDVTLESLRLLGLVKD